MRMKNAFFFTQRMAEEICFSWFLLALRLLFGGLLLMHGIMKIIDFDVLSVSFPDPLGIGSTYSLALAIFAEAACSCAFILGLLFRLSLLPMITTMAVAFWGGTWWKYLRRRTGICLSGCFYFVVDKRPRIVFYR